MDWLLYGVAALMALLIMASAAYALFWSSRTGQWRDFEEGARSIFDDEEPAGKQTDFFPGDKKR